MSDAASSMHMVLANDTITQELSLRISHRAASVAVALGRERNPAATVYDRRKKLAEQQSELRSKTLEFVDYVSQANRVIQQKVKRGIVISIF